MEVGEPPAHQVQWVSYIVQTQAEAIYLSPNGKPRRWLLYMETPRLSEITDSSRLAVARGGMRFAAPK